MKFIEYIYLKATFLYSAKIIIQTIFFILFKESKLYAFKM